MKTSTQMLVLTLALFGGALAASTVHGAAVVDIDDEDAKTFNACMDMPSEQTFADAGCIAVMKKVKVSEADMRKMKSCKVNIARPTPDEGCNAMAKKHPTLTQGHGRSMESSTIGSEK
jgi:hypothetical protein